MSDLKSKKFDQSDSDMDSMADRLARAKASQDEPAAPARPVARPGEHASAGPGGRSIGAPEQPAAPASPETAYIAQHTVAAGETLSHIALKYYGSAAQAAWMHIYEANKAAIGPNPGMIRQGVVLNIPPKPAL